MPDVALIPGGFFFLRNRFKRLRDPFQEIPVYKVSIPFLPKYEFQSPLCQNMSFNPLFAKIWVSIPSLPISIFASRCARSTTRRTRRMWTTNMLCKLSQVLTINCQTSLTVFFQTWHHGQSFFSDLTSFFFQAMERSISMKMMEHGQVFVWLFPLLILM